MNKEQPPIAMNTNEVSMICAEEVLMESNEAAMEAMEVGFGTNRMEWDETAMLHGKNMECQITEV